jgi:hypothetical protein
MNRYKLGKPNQTLLIFSLFLFLTTGCFPTEKGIRQRMNRLKTANAQHQKMLDQELGAEPGRSSSAVSEPKSSVTLEEGDESPAWVAELPVECGRDLYCGLAFVDRCRNANSCREEGETKARDDLRKRISVYIRSETKSNTYAELGTDKSNSGHKTFQSEIRERTASIELKNVSFTHFYLIPQKQLQTLARMKRPKEKKGRENGEAVLTKLPPLLLAFTNDGKTPDLNRPETQKLYQQRFLEALQSEKAKLLKGKTFQDWGSLQGGALSQRVIKQLSTESKGVVVVLSLSGKAVRHDGQMFKGLTKVFLKMAAYNKAGKLLLNRSFEAKRFMVESPDELTIATKQQRFLRTVKKGVDEFETELIVELKRGLSHS